MQDKHRHMLKSILTEELTLEELTQHFIILVQETIIPFIKRLEDMYYSKVDLTLDEQIHLRELKDIVVRYLHFEVRVIERIHKNELIDVIEAEIEDVKRITRDVQALDIDGLEKDFEELLIILESVHARLKKTLGQENPDLCSISNKK